MFPLEGSLFFFGGRLPITEIINLDLIGLPVTFAETKPRVCVFHSLAERVMDIHGDVCKFADTNAIAVLGFIKEQQELGLGSELDADRKTLPGFDVQRYDDCVSEGLKFQELDNLLDVCVPLLFRDMVWLLQVSGEPHRLTEGSRAFVYIHLLGVSGPTDGLPSIKRSPEIAPIFFL